MQSGFQELLDEFLLEARERADEVESMLLRLKSPDLEVRDAAVARARRELHTLKGNSGMMGFSELQELAHRMEDQVEALDLERPAIDDILSSLDELRRGLEGARPEGSDLAGTRQAPATAAAKSSPEAADETREGSGASVRVSFAHIDQLVEMQAETLIFRNRLSDAVRRGSALLKGAGLDPAAFFARSTAAWEDVELAQQALEKVLNQVQERVTDLGMVPLMGLFRSQRRIVHDESTRAAKSVELVIEGGDTPIDKTLLEAAGEALGHLVRNAVIHGIETPEERLRRGKSEAGTVRLKATLEGGEVWIEVADDGAGIDVEAIRRRARERGDDVETGSDLALLFAEGLSTHRGTDLSAGRGVGMAAVKRSVERHGGRLEVRTQRRSGTSFLLRLPVTASILRSLLMSVDGEEYALPLSTVIETLRLSPGVRHEVNQAGVTRWRGQLIPLLDLGLVFGTAGAPRDAGFAVVIDVDGRFRGLTIDAVVGIHDIVVKGLDRIVGQPAGISGSTILGDGRVVMILDPVALARVPPFAEARS